MSKTINIKKLLFPEFEPQKHFGLGEGPKVIIHGYRNYDGENPIKVKMNFEDFMRCVKIVKIRLENHQKIVDQNTKTFKENI